MEAYVLGAQKSLLMAVFLVPTTTVLVVKYETPKSFLNSSVNLKRLSVSLMPVY